MENKLIIGGSNDLEEGDIVDISSIVVLFIDTPDGKTVIRYNTFYLEDETKTCGQEIIRNNIVKECETLMKRQHQKMLKIQEKAKQIPNDFVKAAEKATYRKEGGIKGPLFGLYEAECSYNCCEDTSDRDIWDAMTDGMYGDYQEEGFDGDYEFLGY